MIEKTDRQGAESGFTLIEILLWGSVMLVVTALGLPALQQQMARNRLIGACEQIGVHAQLARVQAVKLGLPVVYAPVYGRRAIRAFVDEDDDQVEDDGEEAVFDAPVPAGQSSLAVYFMGPDLVRGTASNPSESVDGLTVLGGGSNVRGAVFEPDGSIRDTGAFRLADGRTGQANICEVRIGPAATARVEIAKYVYDGPNGDDFYLRGSRTWEWY